MSFSFERVQTLAIFLALFVTPCITKVLAIDPAIWDARNVTADDDSRFLLCATPRAIAMPPIPLVLNNPCGDEFTSKEFVGPR